MREWGTKWGRSPRRRQKTAGERNNEAVCSRFRVPVYVGTLDATRLDGSEWPYHFRLVMN